jgi:hypothetical protein
MKLILLFLALTLNQAMAQEVVRPYETDLCTGYAEGTRDEPMLWADCCKTHDLYLWAGGDRSQRNQADKNLRSCVKEKGGGIHATLIYMGVTVGGLSPWKIKGKQWGNAWGNKVRRTNLTEEEIILLETNLRENSDLTQEAIHAFIEDLKSKNPVEELSEKLAINFFDTHYNLCSDHF